jgi:hypothetical protein
MYEIEIKVVSKNGWFTPSESRAYYGKYARDGVCIHWWGDGTGAGNHDNIVNYISNQAAQGNKSANYVVSDNKITMLVNPDNVAWCQESGNAVEVSFECQPTLGAEGYKKAGWLKWQLEVRYGKRLNIHGHNYWWNTQCPGTLDLNRIEAECRKWESGGYNPAPAPTPVPEPAPDPHADLEWQKLPEPIHYICNKQPTNLWNVDQKSWSTFGAPVTQLAKGSEFIAVARIINHDLGGHYLITEYSYERRLAHGVNEADLSLPSQPTPPSPTPLPSPVPEPIPPLPVNPPEPVPTTPPPAAKDPGWLVRAIVAIAKILTSINFKKK